VKFSLGILGAKCWAIIELVLAGFPTTTTLQLGWANEFKALPYPLKIYPFYPKRSDLSIPGPLGLEPTKIATSHPENPSL